MPHLVQPLAEWSAALLEGVGLGLIVLMSVYALGWAGYRLVRGAGGSSIFRETRHRLVRGILLGLDFLVAADIVHTVAIELTFRSVGVLAAIVAIRTFLSFTLEVEITGRWPWQHEDRRRGADDRSV